MGAHDSMIADRRSVRSGSISDPPASTPQQITERVLRSFDGCPDDRLRELMQALAGHLRGVIRACSAPIAGWVVTNRPPVREDDLADNGKTDE
jgi:hypothetical protein